MIRCQLLRTLIFTLSFRKDGEHGSSGGSLTLSFASESTFSLPMTLECPGDQVTEMESPGKVLRRWWAFVRKRREAGWVGWVPGEMVLRIADELSENIHTSLIMVDGSIMVLTLERAWAMA